MSGFLALAEQQPTRLCRLVEQRAALGRGLAQFSGARASVEDVPPCEWKTALQRSIQILKRHRDVMFSDPEIAGLAPISMIITNLAARSYQGETDIWLALRYIVDKMSSLINPERPWVPNPADPAEDYADKWSRDSRLEKSFQQWLATVRADISRLSTSVDDGSLKSRVKSVFKLELSDKELSLFTPEKRWLSPGRCENGTCDPYPIGTEALGKLMAESIADRYCRWGVEEILDKYGNLRIVPSDDDLLKIRGILEFRVRGPTEDLLEDSYSIELRVPPGYPASDAAVLETGGRIPPSYHKLRDGSLCLAAPTELRLKLGPKSTLGDLIGKFVVPFLFGYSCYEKTGVTPYGELEHGPEGLRQHFSCLFGVSSRQAAQQLVRLASLKNRPANKEPCPCGSGRRLGRCHHRVVNELREKLTRRWFALEYQQLLGIKPTALPQRLKRPPTARERRRQKAPGRSSSVAR